MRSLIPYFSARTLNDDLFSDMDRLLSRFERRTPVSGNNDRTWAPNFETTEAPDHFHLSVDMPGVKKEDINIDIHCDLLTISGERKRRTQKDSETRSEYARVERSFTLPPTVDTTNVEAHFEDGVLELYLPKVAQSQPRKVEIQSGSKFFTERQLNEKKSSQASDNKGTH